MKRDWASLTSAVILWQWLQILNRKLCGCKHGQPRWGKGTKEAEQSEHMRTARHQLQQSANSLVCASYCMALRLPAVQAKVLYKRYCSSLCASYCAVQYCLSHISRLQQSGSTPRLHAYYGSTSLVPTVMLCCAMAAKQLLYADVRNCCCSVCQSVIWWICV